MPHRKPDYPMNFTQTQLIRFGCDPLEEITARRQFVVTLRTNTLVHQQKYKLRQDTLYKLIHHLKESEGQRYRKIAYKLNSWGVRSERGKRWVSASVHSVLKKRAEREERIANQRNSQYPVEIGEISLRYYLNL
ncbi:MAG: hypothetical protein CMP93_00610 [Gammaproteobacteria bacterium]|nr:hypothetical protein [Gammaproteobacteria bacterium]|tara:strand:+ start:333 stop:734 length:402 start_codon:yes stop_codon:yes gene_type:complete